MRFFTSLLVSLVLASSLASAQDGEVRKERHDYQSDVSRLRKIVVNSLYSHRDVFLRELISNSNDALEKLRLIALTEKGVWDGVSPLNITVKAEKDEGGSGRIIITDTGIGMTPEELTKNLGTLAKSGTSEFLSQAESNDGTGTGNLIGAFGLGFYSSFLVADRVYVASTPPKTKTNPNPTQHVFSSSSEDNSFEIYPDPRGNTLGRGTEITLVLSKDAVEYLETRKLEEIINKHSGFTTFPIYLHTERIEEVPEDAEPPAAKPSDEDEVVIEDTSDAETAPQKMKSVKIEEWQHLNSQPPLWLRDPKDVTEEQYHDFYKATFKDISNPIAWDHFSGESNSVAFKALIYIPSHLDDQFWQQGATGPDTRLLVKRVLITNDFGEDGMPKWASWVKVIIDADDLPLNVSRETLQSTKFLKQLKHIILKRIIKIFGEVAEEDPEKYKTMYENYGTALKLGGVEDYVYKTKLAALARFNTNQRDFISLDEYVENKKVGQKQIFFFADAGKPKEVLAKSVFVEKLHARGYEVLLLGEPLDEVFLGQLRNWKNLNWQDVAKAGLKFGDEDEDGETEKEQLAEFKEHYQVLLDWLKEEAKDVVRDVIISNRLVLSSCAIVADQMGYTANIQKLMNAANNQKEGVMHEMAKKQKVLEINPKSPTIEGLLKRVQQLPGEDEEPDLEAVEELKEAASILIDGALVRSGFDVPDSNSFFERLDRVLRRSLGVSEKAPTDTSVRPAPPVDPEMPEEAQLPPLEEGQIPIELPEELKDTMSLVMEPIPDDEWPVIPGHDEL